MARGLAEGKLGPAMRKLRPEHQLFVHHLMELGPEAGNFSRAAAMAGYDLDITSDKTLRQKANRLANDEAIQDAIREESIRRLGSHAALAVTTIIDVMTGQGTSAKDKLAAANMLLGRVGLPAVTEQKISVTHQVDEQDMIGRISLLAKGLGLDPRKLLGSTTPTVIEAEFTEVLALPAPERDATGLEGII